MKKIKSYGEFTNEEINLKKGVATAALGASLLGAASCNEPEKSYTSSTEEPLTWQQPYEDSIQKKNAVDSMTNAYLKRDFRATKAEKYAPIQVTGVSFYYGQYSNFQTIKVRYKNVSDKKIVAFKIRWYDCKDAFGDEKYPSYMGGVSEEPIGTGRSSVADWDLLEKGVKSGKAYCTEAVFDDGTKWELD